MSRSCKMSPVLCGMFIFLFSFVFLMRTGFSEENGIGDFAGGEGTSGDPYRIETLVHLNQVRNNLSAHYVLTEDIDASDTADWNGGEGFFPIGNDFFNAFTGSFDGQGKTISNLYINRGPDIANDNHNNVGLFGYVSYDFVTYEIGEVKNVILENVNVTGELEVGGVAGRIDTANVFNVQVTGIIVGRENVGGVAGENLYGLIENVIADITIEGTQKVGGIVGAHWGMGGLNWSSYGEVYGDDWVGGLVGYNHGNIENSNSDADVFGSGTGYAVGGLAGYNARGCLIGDSYATGDVEGNDDVGGLAGINDGNIKNSYATGRVEGQQNIGGLAGFNDGSILNCYARGDVQGGQRVGGLVGHNLTVEGLGLYAYIKNCYSTGRVSGDSGVGGLVGTNYQGNTADSFWDLAESGQTISAGGEGKTTAELKTEPTFISAGWDFVNVWAINDSKNNGYPIIIREWKPWTFAPRDVDGEFSADDSEIILVWNQEEGAVSYNIYMGVVGGTELQDVRSQTSSTEIKFSSLYEVDGSVTELTDKGLMSEYNYYYIITSINESGEESALSSDVLSANSGTGQIVKYDRIAWGAERIKEFTPPDDPDPDPDDDDDEEEPRRRRPAPDPDPDTDPDPPLPPDAGTPGFDGFNCNLNWGDSPTPGISNFNVYVSTGGEGLALGDVSGGAFEGLKWTLLAQLPPDTTEYTHEGLTPGVRYYYVITSQLADGTESVETSEVMWVDTGTGETGKFPPIEWSEDRVAPDVDDDDSSTCFIATAAYGSGMSSEVVSLRAFREGFLMSSAPGRLFTDAYYRFSPALAEAVEGNRVLGYIIRLHLAPMVDIAGRFLSMN